MPRACNFECELAAALEDVREIRELFRHRKSLLGWQDGRQGLPSLNALSLNIKVMTTFASVYTEKVDRVKAPSIMWIRKEAVVVSETVTRNPKLHKTINLALPDAQVRCDDEHQPGCGHVPY